MHTPGLGVQGGIQRERAVAMILKPMAFGGPGDSANTGSKRSSAWIAVFSSTQNGGMLRGIQIQPDDIGGLPFKFRIVAGQIALQPVRLQSGFPPYPMHHVFTDADRRG